MSRPSTLPHKCGVPIVSRTPTNGFVFVNNYQRLQAMPPKTNVQFTVNLPSGAVTFPERPVTIPPDACFIWPFNLELGKGIRLAWATAQPLTAINDGDVRTVFFAETKGVPARFGFDRSVGSKSAASLGHGVGEGGDWSELGSTRPTVVRELKPGVGAAMRFKGKDGTLQIVLMNDAESLALWKGKWQGKDRIFLTRAGLVLDGDNLRLASTNRSELSVAVYPAPRAVGELRTENRKQRTEDRGQRTENSDDLMRGKADGIFLRFTPRAPGAVAYRAAVEQVQQAGPPREIPLGKMPPRSCSVLNAAARHANSRPWS
jgi:hypothetical protein